MEAGIAAQRIDSAGQRGDRAHRKMCRWERLAGSVYNRGMAKLGLAYGMRLLPLDEIVELGDAPIKLKNGREARVTVHLLEGSKEEIEKQLRASIEAFFDFYPEI
jgi:hypothetical protein